jgi:DNA mismatch endonuclease, patch repair protein
MSHVKLKGNRVEHKLAVSLFHLGIRYRLNYKKLPGSPDIAITKYRIAIFVDGSFWHGYNWSERKLKLRSNREFWESKIEENIQRDSDVSKKCETLGWVVIRFWDFEIEEKCGECVNIVIQTISNRRNK